MKSLPRKRSIIIAVICCGGVFAISLAASRRLFHRILPFQNSAVETERNKASGRREAGKDNQATSVLEPVGPINPRVIAGGGGTSSGGTIKVEGTIGEPGAARTSSGGSITVSGGFWNAIQGTATSSPSPTPSPSASPTIQFEAGM